LPPCLCIRDELYWITEGAYSTMLLVGEEGVNECDAPPSPGARYLTGIREVTDKRIIISHLIYRHEHWATSAGQINSRRTSRSWRIA